MALTRITKGVIKPNENYDTHNINSTGIVTAIGLDVNGNGDISGNLSVGGVLTYEDVTSIDSVGIITARNGIHVGAGVSAVGVGTFGSLDIGGDIDVDGHTNLDNVSIAGLSTHNEGIFIPDEKKAEFGNAAGSGDLQIYHTPSDNNNSFIKHTGAGALKIAADHFRFRNAADNTNILNGITGGAVTLYFAGNEKLKTTSDGIEVPDAIRHLNDTNTKIRFPAADTFTVETGGSTRLRAENSGLVITGVTTFSASAHVSNTSGSVFFGAGSATAYGSQGGIGRAGGANYHIGSSAIGDLCIAAEGSKRILFGTKTGTGIGGVTKRMSIASNGQVTIDGNLDAVGGIDATANSTFAGDIDVDGHTNLDNVSIAGFTTISSTSNGEIFRIETSAGNPGGTQGLAYMGFDHFSSSTKPAILIGSEEAGNASYMGNFVIKLKDAAATDDDPVQRFKIDSSGRVMIGRASAYASNDADNLIVGDEAVNEHQGITILSHSGKYGGIYFGDGSGSNPAERGKIIYDHPNDQLRIGTGGSAATQFYINSAGEVGISVSPASGHLLHIKNSGSADSKVKIESESGHDARLILDTSNGGGAGGHIDFQIDGTLKGGIQYVSNASASDTHDIIFRNNDNSEKVRITSDGKVGINIAGSDNTTPVRNLDIADASGAILRLISTDDSLSANERLGEIEFYTDDDDGGHIGAYLKAISDPSDSFGRRTALTFGVQSNESQNAIEKMRLTAGGQLFINSTAAVNTNDFLTIKRPAGNTSVTSMTLDATTSTASYANALIFTKAKDYYYNGIIFTSSSGHQGGICGKMSVAGGTAPQIDFRIGGTGFNSSDKLAMTIYNNADIQMHGSSSKDLKWDESEASLYLTDANSGASAKLKIGTGGDLQLYHDVGGANHIVAANNQEIKISANTQTFYDYTGVTKRLEIDASAKLRTRGASDTGHGGMVYIQGYSDPVADETHSNLTVRGEGGNGFACGTYEGTANYASWIQAGYVPNFTGTAPSAIYPLVLQPNGAPVCIGNKYDASTTDSALLRVQTVTGSSYAYQKYGLSLEHFNSSDAREQKFLFINENSQGTQAEANSIFRQHATPYMASTTYQVWTDRIVYQHRPLFNQYSWYKFNVHVTSSSRGGSARIGITWSSRHAGPGGYGEYSFAWTDEHHTSRAQVFLRKQHFLTSGGASHGPYNWTSSPAVTVYSSTGGGSQGGFYLRVEGHLDANSSTYDGGVMHHFDIVHNDNNTGGNNTYFEFVQYGSGGPSQASQVLSFN